MPYVNVKLAGNITEEQKEEIAAQITRTLYEIAGKPPSATYVVIEEVNKRNWAVGGKLLSKN